MRDQVKIATKTGDDGTTGLLFGARVSKADDRIDLIGAVDELSACIGIVKAELTTELAHNSGYNVPEYAAKSYAYKDLLSAVQEKLIYIMGEIACEMEDRPRYQAQFTKLEEGDLNLIDTEVIYLEGLSELEQRHWVLYGKNRSGATCHYASKVCRRVERNVVKSNLLYSRAYRPLIIKYLNRLSDLLYLIARFFEELSPKYH